MSHFESAYDSFSRKGLIGQLKFEGFSTADATYGASHSGANWMRQAVLKAKDYLKFDSFSYSGCSPRDTSSSRAKSGLLGRSQTSNLANRSIERTARHVMVKKVTAKDRKPTG